MKNFNFLGTLALVCVLLFSSCAEEYVSPAKAHEEHPVVTPIDITNFQGGSTATHTYDGGKLLVQIFLDKKVILLDKKDELGKANYESGNVMDTIYFIDSQKAWVYISYDKNVYQNVSLTFLDYTPQIDNLTATITQRYAVSFGLVKVEGTYGSDPNEENSYCRPWYIQSATEDDDIVIVKTDTTFTVTTTISGSSVIGRSTVKYPTVEVDKAQLGKLSLTNESQSVSNLDDGFMMTVTDNFNDGQIGTNTAICRHDAEAKAWVEVTDIKYVTYYPTTSDGQSDIKLKEVYTLEGRGKLAGKSWQVELFPSYRQVAKPTADNIIFNVVNSGTTSTGTGKTSISDSQISVTLKLAKTSVEVDKAQLGKVSITKTTGPTLTNYSANGKSGKKAEQAWTLNDGQSINGDWWWLYAAAADNHLEIEKLGTPNFTPKSTSDKESEITIRIPATVKMVGETSASKNVEFILVYKQVAKEDVYTCSVDTWSDPSSTSMLQYTKVTVFKNGSEISVKQFRSAACGAITSVTELYVSSTTVERSDNVRDDTSPDWTGTSTSVDGVVTYEFTKNSKIHHFTRSFTSDAGGLVKAIDGEYRFMTSTITVKVNGKVLKTITFTPSTTITVDKLEQVSGVPTQKVASGHTYTYAGSWHLVITNTINGDKFHESDCKPILWKY